LTVIQKLKELEMVSDSETNNHSKTVLWCSSLTVIMLMSHAWSNLNMMTVCCR